MRFNFRKISALATSALLVGLTAGTAAAASYPAPFVVGGQADFAVVYGASPPASVLDQTNAASPIATQLLGLSSGSVGLGSDTVQIRGPVQQFHLGRNASAVFTTGDIRKSDMPELLADGSYFDDDNTEFKFTQKITLGSALVLNHFKDSDYSDTPAIGINLNSGATVLTYTMDFNTRPDFTDAKMGNTDLPLFGKNYFVLSVGSTDKIELLDSAETTVLNQDDSTTVTLDGSSYSVSIQAISSSGVIFVVNGVTTNRLNTGNTYKLPDGSFLGLKDFQQAQFAGDTAFAEFSIGSGKLVLTDGAEVELNDEVINGLTAGVGNVTNKLNNITLTWVTDDREFITPTSELTMPGFGTLKLAMTDFFMPSEEAFTVERDGDSVRLSNFPFADGTKSLNLVYGDTSGVIQGLGRDANNILVTSDDNSLVYQRAANHKMFVVSYNETAWAESYLLSIPSVVFKDGTNKTTIRNEVTGQNICVELSPLQTCTIGPITLTIAQANRTDATDWNVSLTTSAGAGGFSNLYSEEGMKVYLPFLNDDEDDDSTKAKGELFLGGNENWTAGHNETSWDLYFEGKDKDGNLASGSKFHSRITASSGSTVRLHASSVTNSSAPSQLSAVGGLRIGDSGDRYEYYTLTDVPTRITHDQSGDHYRVEIAHATGESYGRVFLSSTDAVDGEVPGLGSVLVTAGEVSAVQSRNLVVVGGSCINSVAATLVGGALCGESWASSTGVGSGQFLIQSFASPYQSGKVALLVAGYNVDDTVNAATYLRNQGTGLDVAAGKKYTGTTATAPVTTVA